MSGEDQRINTEEEVSGRAPGVVKKCKGKSDQSRIKTLRLSQRWGLWSHSEAESPWARELFLLWSAWKGKEAARR